MTSARRSFISFEEFLERKKQGTDFSLKPVAPSPEPATVEPETEDAAGTAGDTPPEPTSTFQPEVANTLFTPFTKLSHSVCTIRVRSDILGGVQAAWLTMIEPIDVGQLKHLS